MGFPISFIARPSSQDSDIISFVIAGKIDIPKLLANPSLVRDEFYEMSGRRDIVLDEVVWISTYRWALTCSWFQMPDTDHLRAA